MSNSIIRPRRSALLGALLTPLLAAPPVHAAQDPAPAREAPATLAKARELFATLDRDGNRSLSAREGSAAGIQKRLFDGFDLQDDGRLEPDEFVLYYRYLARRAGRTVAKDIEDEAARIKVRVEAAEKAREAEAVRRTREDLARGVQSGELTRAEAQRIDSWMVARAREAAQRPELLEELFPTTVELTSERLNRARRALSARVEAGALNRAEAARIDAWFTERARASVTRPASANRPAVEAGAAAEAESVRRIKADLERRVVAGEITRGEAARIDGWITSRAREVASRPEALEQLFPEGQRLTAAMVSRAKVSLAERVEAGAMTRAEAERVDAWLTSRARGLSEADRRALGLTRAKEDLAERVENGELSRAEAQRIDAWFTQRARAAATAPRGDDRIAEELFPANVTPTPAQISAAKRALAARVAAGDLGRGEAARIDQWITARARGQAQGGDAPERTAALAVNMDRAKADLARRVAAGEITRAEAQRIDLWFTQRGREAVQRPETLEALLPAGQAVRPAQIVALKAALAGRVEAGGMTRAEAQRIDAWITRRARAFAAASAGREGAGGRSARDAAQATSANLERAKQDLARRVAAGEITRAEAQRIDQWFTQRARDVARDPKTLEQLFPAGSAVAPANVAAAKAALEGRVAAGKMSRGEAARVDAWLTQRARGTAGARPAPTRRRPELAPEAARSRLDALEKAAREKRAEPEGRGKVRRVDPSRQNVDAKGKRERKRPEKKDEKKDEKPTRGGGR